MRAANLPSTRGHLSNAHALRIEGAKSISQVEVQGKRNGLGYSENGDSLYTFALDFLNKARSWTRAASIAQTSGGGFTVSTADKRRTVTVTATWADGTAVVVCRPASATVTMTTQPANGETVTINGKVYTFQTTLTNVDGNVLRGADANASAANLAAAINLGTGSGTTYAAATTLVSNVYARVSTNVVTLESHGLDHYSAGNAITLSRTGTNMALSGAVFANGAFDARCTFGMSDATKATVGVYGTITWVAAGSTNLTATFQGRTDLDAVTAS